MNLRRSKFISWKIATEEIEREVHRQEYFICPKIELEEYYDNESFRYYIIGVPLLNIYSK